MNKIAAMSYYDDDYDEQYGDVYLGDDSPASIIGHGRFKLKLEDGRIRTLPGVLHIPNIARNLISVGKMDVAGVNIVCGDGGCKMVR